MAWEYFDMLISCDKRAKYPIPDLSQIEYFGTKGWELCYCEQKQIGNEPSNAGSVMYAYYCIFKREKMKI